MGPKSVEATATEFADELERGDMVYLHEPDDPALSSCGFFIGFNAEGMLLASNRSSNGTYHRTFFWQTTPQTRILVFRP